MSQAQLLPSSAGNTCQAALTFKAHPIRTVMDGDSLWFVARDVCAALNVAWCGAKTLAAIPAEWQRVGNLPTRTRDGRAQINKTIQINEPAVYKLAFRSNKTEADAFTNWVASEVIPAIRKTGKYGAQDASILSPDQCRQLHNIMDAKMSALHPDSRRAGYAEGWTRFNRHFKIAKYEQLPPARFSEALDYLIGLSLKVRSALPAPSIAAPQALPALPDDLRERLKAHASKCLDFTGEVCTRARQLMCEGSRLSYEVASHIDPLFQHTPSGYLNRTRVYDAMTTFSSNGIKAIEAGTDNIYLTARMMEGLAGLR